MAQATEPRPTDQGDDRSEARGDPPRPGPAILAVAAGCVAAAGALHFAAVTAHLGDDTSLAITFALAGWVQLATAIALAVRPDRLTYGVTVVTNAVFIGAWALSRTAGLPFGPHAGEAETIGALDATTVALEGVAVLLGVALLARPTLGARWDRAALVVASLPLAVVLIGSTVAVTSDSAAEHAAGGGHDHGDGELLDGVHEGDHSEHGAAEWQPLDYETQQQLTAELTAARESTMRYPTVADLKAAGGRRLGVFTPGNGAHHTMPVPGVPIPEKGFDLQAIMGNVQGFDPANPPIVLYSGTDDDSVPVGLMYVVFQEEEPEGFAGPNDVWHRHQGVCAEIGADGGVDVLLPIASDTTEEQCDEVGGNHLNVTPWMVHVWTAPGWESTEGVFSHENPILVCRDDTSTDVAADFAQGCDGFG